MDSDNSSSKVQHVTKKSSDELLRKFADDDEAPATKSREIVRVSKRRRKSRESRESDHCESSKLTERRSLLPAPARKPALLRQIGIHGRVRLRGREIRHKSLFGTIEKTWRRTIEGASKVFMAKHYNRHKRLINDIV